MVKNIASNELTVKRFFKIVLKIFLILLSALILYIVGGFALSPVFDKFDHDKFIDLDTQMQGVYRKLQAASGGADDWKYEKVCNDELAGDWPTGMYFCDVTMSLNKKATSVDDVNNMQAKYYPIINGSNALKKTTELDPESLIDFGKNFVVSSAEQRYKEIKTGVECDYLIKLYQDATDGEYISNAYGSYISVGSGYVRASLVCSEKARGSWYPSITNR